MQGAGRESTTLGSSPLARGTLNEAPEAYMPTGLIPARAGNTEMV